MPVLRLADRVGRRRMLLVSVLAFTVATAATSLAWGLVSFVVFQMVARLFLATEESLAGIVISEEVRPDRRGAGLTLLGIIAMTGFGLVAIMLLVVPLTPLDWRILYLAALPPLLLVAWLRRNLRETRAFTVAQAQDRVQASLLAAASTAPTGRTCGASRWCSAPTACSATPMFFYAAELAQDGYGWEGLFTVIVIAAGPATLLGYVAGGRLSDRVGRKPIVSRSSLVVVLGVLLVFSEAALAVRARVLPAGRRRRRASPPVRPAYLSELFPTEVRATLLAFVLAVIVAAGSLGLVVVGAARRGGGHRGRAVVGLTGVMLAGPRSRSGGSPRRPAADVDRARDPPASLHRLREADVALAAQDVLQELAAGVAGELLEGEVDVGRHLEGGQAVGHPLLHLGLGEGGALLELDGGLHLLAELGVGHAVDRGVGDLGVVRRAAARSRRCRCSRRRG